MLQIAQLGLALHRTDVAEPVGAQPLRVGRLAEDGQRLVEELARGVVEVVAVQVRDEHGVEAGDDGLRGLR